MGRKLADQLGLVPHPEGGAFREIWRSPVVVPHPEGHGPRAASTAIHFLLTVGEFSAYHEVRSDEIWILLDGGPLELHLISPKGEVRQESLLRGSNGEPPHQVAIVPALWLQAARPAKGAPHALCCCVVAPGFDFADFHLPTREELLSRHPHAAGLIAELTHSP